MYEEIKTEFDQNRLIFELNVLVKKIPFDENAQICLTHRENSLNPYYEGCGSLYYEGNYTTGTKTKRNDSLTEGEFNIFNIELYSTYFYDIYNTWSKNFNIGRLRLMKLNRKICLTWHKDNEKRIHLPIITDEKCKFVVEDNVFHLPANGNSFIIDTTKYHTVFNGSSELERVHLVGSLVE